MFCWSWCLKCEVEVEVEVEREGALIAFKFVPYGLGVAERVIVSSWSAISSTFLLKHV